MDIKDEPALQNQRILEPLSAPFPWYGGKSRAAGLVWERFGTVKNYVEPFFGSGAILFNSPYIPSIETINDKDCFVVNIFRALQADPDAVAHWCDFPVNEAQQHAVHAWLVNQREVFTAKLMGDPDYYDAKVAGRWCWGLCCWIGSGWCSGTGAWQSVDGQLVHLGNAGQGVHRQLVHLGDAGKGVHRKLVHLGDAGKGSGGLSDWFQALATRLKRVRVCCGDWQRVLGPSVTYKHGLTGIVLDPPYSAEEGRADGLYGATEDLAVAHAVRQWCLENGSHPLLRIAFCGYENVHDELLQHGWTKEHWKAQGGYGVQRKKGVNLNNMREVIYLNPACLPPAQPSLFG